ncbi:UDP-N-acetylglucosamine--N-acetylmuramyl-(pentapeptide) pyrophosphoryl-undecaprenol N-acetylglucosamine transferase [Campylobacterota bacterium]|nr:UDP-N-acetylglucosamine--N-acetylmuramyl-(pentapeptide) pyrophosphoryl-undecaprenol N-acetylglucosamine transferase [Campylobacterota bacterium]
MIAITGGGTGGHLAVAQAVKDALNNKGFKPLFIGSANGLDKLWFGKEPGFIDRVFLSSRPIMNRGIFGRVFGMLGMVALVFKMRTALRLRGVKVVFSVGGYSAAPAAIAAVTLRIPLVIHEQNAVMGTLNKYLRPFAKIFYSSFDPESEMKDYPIKRIFFETARIRTNVRVIIFLGGSQGAKAINDFAMQVAPSLHANGIEIIHQCGKNGLEECAKFYEENNIKATYFDFSPNIVEYIAKADLAVARSGAGTIFELAANGLPALYVPYPFAAGNHQTANAKYICARELSWCFDQSRLCPEALDNILPLDLSEISTALTKTIRLGGAQMIAEKLLQLKRKIK